jgi:hypothetical protein
MTGWLEYVGAGFARPVITILIQGRRTLPLRQGKVSYELQIITALRTANC